MKQSNKTKKSLLASFMALVMCFSMFAGTTLAWFTDTATTGVQNIVTGKLDVDIVDANDNTLTKAPLSFVKAKGHENEEVLWEPGVTYDVEDFYIKNNGNLALKYKLYINGAVGDAKLLEAIDFTVKINGNEVKLNNFEGELLAGEKSGLVKVSAKMREEAGNVYQGLKLHGIGFTVYATQNDVEFDSFGKEYDKDSEYSVITNPVNVFTTIPADIIGEDNKLTEDLEIVGPQGVTATIPAGTKIAEGAKHLNFTVVPMAESSSNIQLKETEKVTSVDVHIEGIAEDNETPISISLGNILSKGLNQGNYGAYHVENDVPEAMSENNALSGHNDFTYDPATGFVTIAIKSFSEIAVYANTENAWNGNIATAFSGGEGTKENPYIIANADQLTYFGDLISNDNENYGDKYYKLIADINLGGEEKANKGIIWYPIGYHKLGNPVEAVAVDDAPEAVYYGDEDSAPVQRPAMTIDEGETEKWYTYGGAFKGTFDGNGHKISNIYQNTWQLKGNYDGNYWNAAMGVFGYVYGGTVKNLTVDNFSSDGEYTPTGVIAAYACNATFENIAITNCNPRVYNTGNGGIVGIGGNSSDPDTYKLTFTNITIDNSNTISALWGSWDVACGGLVGMFRGAGHVYMTNCHVAAQIDVYNDVCGNYQYYWYRYAGMMIGTNKTMITDENGYTVPETSKFHAEGCTVHFGEWNNYWYCELVANSLASYTHDHQFSRLTQVDSVDVVNKTVTVDGKTTDIPTSGRVNYVVVTKPYSTKNATCYHFVNGDVWNHEDAGTEKVNGETVLKENNQHIYLPFNQLFTGYGWGVKHIPVYNGEDYAFEGITILDREVADSVEKFAKADTAKESYTTETTVTIGELFTAVENAGVDIDTDNVQVTVSPADENSKVTAVYEANKTDWKQGTLTFEGVGKATITITDYYFCTPTTINVTITEKVAAEKFESKFTGDFLYRVGNVGTVSLDKLFAAKDGAKIGTVSVTVESVNGTSASGTYTENATWTNGTIQFSGTGVVKVKITDTADNFCTPTVLYLEVVDAVNVTSATNATANNVVLLNDIGSGFTVSGRYTVYGNGFTLNYTGNGQYLNNGLKQGVVTVSENGTLDNVRIKATIYPNAYMYYGTTSLGDYVQGGPYSKEGDKTRYHYQLSAVAASGNATISNCYIYGGRNNIFVNTGDVTIKDSVLESGTVANVQIQSNSDYTVTFEDVTTIQYQVNPTIGDTSKVMLGAGVLVGPDTETNPTIVLKGNFKQYNWVTDDDAKAVSDDVAKKIINGALNATEYNHTVDGKKASNLGIIYMNTERADIENNTVLPYKLGTISMSSISGNVYSLQNAKAEQIYSDYENADKSTVNDAYKPQFKYSADLGGQYIEKDSGDEHCYREGDTIHVMFPSGDTKELDLAKLVDIKKYEGQDLNLTVTCKDEKGNAVPVNDGKVVLSNAGEYTVTYSVTDTLFYDKDGNTVTDSKAYSWDVTVSVSLKDTAVPNAYFEFDSTKQLIYRSGNSNIKQFIPFLAGLKIYDYNGQTSYLRFDGDNDFNKIAKATIDNVNTSGEAQGYHIVTIELVDGGKIVIDMDVRANSGSSTHTGSIKVRNNVIYVLNGGTTSGKGQTWKIYSYKFVGNNGTEINSGAVTFGTAGVDCSTATAPSNNFSTTIKATVTYDANGGNCGQTTGYATSAAAAVTLPTPTRSGYIFAGWYTAASGGTRVGGAGDSYTPSANITLYAQWGKPCTVTYNANGGSCGTASEKYTGTALTLPTPTRDGYWFIGWYDAAEGGNKVGDAGATYNPAGETTLYAHWQEQIEYTVTYNANGGSCGTASATYKGTTLTLPTATRTGYTFNGWYTAASGGTKIGDAGASYTPSANITLYAQWEQVSYTITISKQDNATVTVDKTTAHYNDTISVTVSFSQSNSKTLTVKDASGNTVLSKSAAGTHTFTMPASNVTIEASSSGGCVTPETFITLADGTQKQVQYLTGDEMLLAWNHETKEFVSVPTAYIVNHDETDREYEVITLVFSDGSDIEIIGEHVFFDATLNKYVTLDSNAEEFIGHKFLKASDDYNKLEKVKLVKVEKETRNTKAYEVVTYKTITCFTDDILSASAYLDKILNVFDINPLTYGYNMRKVQKDIETYGLYTYDDFEGLIDEKAFDLYNAAYLKVAVGKGYITWNDILNLIDIYFDVEVKPLNE